MSPIQKDTLSADILRNLGVIAEDENLLNRVAKYLRRIVKQKQDESAFTQEEFMARISEARKQPGKQFSSVDELDQFIRSL